MELATFLRNMSLFLLRQMNQVLHRDRQLFVMKQPTYYTVVVVYYRHLFYRVLHYSRCHGMFRRMQAVKTIKQPCSGTRKKETFCRNTSQLFEDTILCRNSTLLFTGFLPRGPKSKFHVIFVVDKGTPRQDFIRAQRLSPTIYRCNFTGLGLSKAVEGV